ncbi:MAG: RRQRL motif-containing zinc-binding protein [Actinopolymorphaceae bacterium]
MGRSARRRREYVWFTLWDGRNVLCRWVDGQPAFRFRQAPTGLATRRQLRQAGLCPGGQPPYALLVWRRDDAWAALYRLDLAKPKRVPTPAQRAALAMAMEARRTCRECGEDVGYCVPTSTGTCWNCFWKSEEEAAA